jgi:hypothetical protein
MITNTWDIVQLDCQPDEYVVTAHWALSATEGTYTGYIYGAVSFEVDPNKTPYIAFADITLEDTIAWVRAAIGEEQVATYEKTVADQIQAQITPTILAPKLPWL